PPMRFAGTSETASMQQAADTAEDNPDWRHDGKQVPRRLLVTGHLLGDLHTRIATKERADDGLARRPDQPAVRRIPEEPAFRREINEFCPGERAEQCTEV